jgi:hypothetical protein
MSPFRRDHTKRKKLRTPLKWFILITLVAASLAAVVGWGGGAINFIENYFTYHDDSYRPMDTERQAPQVVPEQTQTKSSTQSGP